MSNKDKMIEELASIAMANEESALAPLLDMFNPGTNRIDSGRMFTEVIGYNPITHFDIADIDSIMDSLMKELSVDAITALSTQRDRVCKRAYEIFEDSRELRFRECVAQAYAEIAPAYAADVATALNVYLEDDSVIDVDDDEDISSNSMVVDIDDLDRHLDIDDGIDGAEYDDEEEDDDDAL